MGGVFGLSIIKHVTLQNIVAHDFRYDPRRYRGLMIEPWYCSLIRSAILAALVAGCLNMSSTVLILFACLSSAGLRHVRDCNTGRCSLPLCACLVARNSAMKKNANSLNDHYVLPTIEYLLKHSRRLEFFSSLYFIHKSARIHWPELKDKAICSSPYYEVYKALSHYNLTKRTPLFCIMNFKL